MEEFRIQSTKNETLNNLVRRPLETELFLDATMIVNLDVALELLFEMSHSLKLLELGLEHGEEA